MMVCFQGCNVANKNSLLGILVIDQFSGQMIVNYRETDFMWKNGREDILPEPCDCWSCGGTGCSSCR